eukprot:gene15569-35345_t
MTGSVSWADMTLPVGKVLLVEVSTSIPSLTSASGFFVRPTRRTREWGKAEVAPSKATFYIADTGQFSVEFASAEFWRGEAAFAFDALMLFVNPELEVPAAGVGANVISPNTNSLAIDLGPNKAYIFTAANTYDWGRDQVFKVDHASLERKAMVPKLSPHQHVLFLSCSAAAVVLTLTSVGADAACVNNYGPNNKPWEDFVSCADEKEFCKSDALLRKNCQKTCGTCTTPSPPSPPSPGGGDSYTVRVCVAASLTATCKL